MIQARTIAALIKRSNNLKKSISSIKIFPWSLNRKSVSSLSSTVSKNPVKSQTNSNENEADAYLSSMGYTDTALQDGMKDALKAVFGKDIKVSHLKSMGESGKSMSL